MASLFVFRRFTLPIFAFLAMLAALPALAAKLVPEKGSIAVGETLYIRLEAGFSMGAQWSASGTGKVDILSSDSKGATVRGVAPGEVTINVKWLTGKKSTRISVTDRDSASQSDLARALLAPPVQPLGSQIISPAEEMARQKIAAFEATFDPNFARAAGMAPAQVDALRKVRAFEISSDYTARRLLKTSEFSDLGKEYFKTWFDEGDGLIHRIIARAKGKMTGYSSDVLDLIRVIQNEKSKISMKAPMDFDVGILTKTRAEAVRIMKKLGGPAAVSRFHEELEHALRAAYLEIFAELGGTSAISPVRAFISATTAWHPEAYADAKVLKEGGVASRDLVQQTTDVSKYKVREMQRHAREGTLTLEEAMEEAARGTAKDLDKVERVFKHIEKITGVKPAWTAEQEEIIRILKQVEAMEMSASAANAEIARISRGRLSLFDACDQLMEQMGAAWKLRKVHAQELLLSILAEHLDDADYDKAFKAVVAGKMDDVPASAKKIISELDTTAKLRLISMQGGSAQQFLRDLAGDFPNFKIMEKPGDESLQRLVKLIESEAAMSSDDIVAVFGKDAAEKYKIINGWLPPPVKYKIVMRYGSNKFAIWELDKKGRVLLGDAGATLKFDAAIGLAMGFWQTASIMDQNLSPEEESRAILNAWGTALPVVGDIAQGLIEGAEGWYGDDRSKLFKAGIWIVIGSAQLVPGAQAAGLAAGLGLMSYEIASSIWDVSKDKALVEAWLTSGDWDKNSGKLKALFDAGKKSHELSPEGLFRNGDVGYLSGLEGLTIRDSLYQFAERNGLDQLETLQSYLRALKGLYPDFPFKETLREPLTIGKPLFAARIREGSGMNTNPFRSVEMLMFVKAKQIVDAETSRATQRLIEQVEAEYQARRHTGSALAAYRDLEALGQRLGLPLVKHVKETFISFSGFVTEAIKTPWVRESLPRREVMLIEKYLAGYLEIEKSLKRIQSIFQQAGIHPPSHNLSGWLEIDAPRIKDLEAAYANRAVGDVAREVQRIHREASGDDTYVFKAAQPDPCDAELFRTLSGIMVRIIDAEDRLLLLQQWSGKKSAAETSRDEKLRTAQKATEDMKKSVEIWIPGYSDMFGPWKSTVGALPGQLWDGLATSYEEAYAWAHLTWEGSQVYGNEAVGVAERIERLKDDYRRAVEAGAETMRDCVGKTLKCALKLSDPAPKKGSRITATATVSPTDPPRDATWNWSGSGGVAVVSSARNKANLVITGQGTVSLAIEDSKRAKLAECTASVTPDDTKDTDLPSPPAPKFSATLPGNWEMQPIKDGVRFVRREAKTKGPCGRDSSVSGSVTALFKAGTMDDKALQARIAETQAGLEKQKAERKIGCATPDMAVGLFKAGGLDGVASLALGEFKGGIVDYPNWVRRGSGGWMSGYTGSSMIACGNGAAHGKSGSIEFSYSASGGGCWDNSDRAYLVRQVLAAQKEARAIIASLRLDGAGIRTEPYKGPKYDGSDNPLVRLLPEKLPKLKVGDLATVEAVVENAEPEDPPYTYDWDGSFHGKAEDLKKSAKVTLHPQKPGKYKVGVSVSGQRYGMGYASLEYEVADVQVKVERVPNENTPVPVGGRARFKATLLIDGKPAEGAYIYRWQPNTELVFSATESATASQTTTTFTRLDERQKLWVEVLEPKEGRLATVGESDRLEIRVIQPRLSLSAEPKEPLVGQETRVTLKDEPRLDDKVAGFRWAHKGDALNPGATQDERVFTFKPKNLKPVTVTARGYLRDGNVDLGEAELAIQPKAYEVKLNPPRARGPQLQVWVCDTQLGQAQKCGMKDIPQGQFATFQDILIQSAVTPQPTAPRYRWSVEPSGSCGLPGAGSELRLNCSNTGSYTVKLQVTDADNVLLGEAETSVTVSVSDKDVKQAPKSKEAYEKMQQARQKANEGLLDEAITLAGTASGLDPKNSEARDLGNRWNNERNTVRQQLERAKKALAANRPDEAQKELDAAKTLHPKYPPVVEVEKQIADKRKAAGVTTTVAPGAASQPISLAGVGGKQGTPRVVKGVAIDDGSWIRFKSTDENRRSLDIPVPTPTRAEAVAIVSNLDDATYLEQGKTIVRILVGKDSGDEVLDIQAGVHSSEWNYGVGPKHKRVDSADIGGNRFLVVLPLARPGMVRSLRIEYVDTGAPKWAGHAPGFVLRGISLVADTRGLTLTPGGHSASTVDAGAVNVAGQWRTSEGVMTLTQNGRAVTGNYTNDGGEIVGEMNDKVLEGWWIENSSNERCAAPKNGRYYWGRIRFTFSGERFSGTWSYCDKPATGNSWTGERIDTASAGGASLHLDRTTFKPGERIEVRFTAPASWPDDAWVGIVPSAIPHGDERQNDNHDIAYQYLNKRTSGTLTFTAPAAGDWDFRLHDTDRNGKEYASVSFRVGTVAEGGRDYTGITPVPGGPSQGYLRIEACVDGSDWIRIDNGRLTHEHRAFNQIGTHPSCPASHRVAGGGFLVDGRPVALDQLPRTVGMAGIDRIEVERGRGVVRLDGPNRILIDDDGPGGADVYIIRVYPGAGSIAVGDGVPGGLVNVPGGRDYTGPAMDGAPGEFAHPQVDGIALDICREWGANCGKPAADAFCQRQGYAESSDHRIQHDTPPTRIISSGEVCNESFCDRIVWVKCSGGTGGATPPAGQLIFEVGNIGGVANGPNRPTTFTLAQAHRITMIRNYHWNSARGAKPGTIALRDASGRVWGPWQATGSLGQGGVPNAYWTVYPNVTLPAGTYTVIDSDPASWSHNAESDYRGFVRVEGHPAEAAATPPSSPGGKPQGVLKEIDELRDAIKSLKGLFGK